MICGRCAFITIPEEEQEPLQAILAEGLLMIYLARADGKVIGKFSEEEFRAKISAGDVSPDDQYLNAGGAGTAGGPERWRRASEFPGAIFPQPDPHEEILPPIPPPIPKLQKKKRSPADIGGLCALLGMFAPLASPVLFFLLSLPLLVAAFVLAIVSLARGKIGSGIGLLILTFVAFMMSITIVTNPDIARNPGKFLSEHRR
jgi:hypothetical protein